MCSSPSPPEQPEPAAKPAPPPSQKEPKMLKTGADQNKSTERRQQDRKATGTSRLRIKFNPPDSGGSGLSLPTSN